MDYVQVTIEDSTLKQLDAANGCTVELRASDGRVVGYCVTPEQLKSVQRKHQSAFGPADEFYTPEELSRIVERNRNDPRPRKSMEDAFRLFETS